MRLTRDRDARVFRRPDRGLFWLITLTFVVGLVWLASTAYFTILSALEIYIDFDLRAFNGSTRWLQVAVTGSRAGYMVLLAGAVMVLLFRRSKRS